MDCCFYSDGMDGTRCDDIWVVTMWKALMLIIYKQVNDKYTPINKNIYRWTRVTHSFLKDPDWFMMIRNRVIWKNLIKQTKDISHAKVKTNRGVCQSSTVCKSWILTCGVQQLWGSVTWTIEKRCSTAIRMGHKL